MEQLVEYNVRGRVATLTMNRPDKRNALNAELVAGLSEALAEAGRDDAVRAVILTGAGPVFSAGADLADLQRLQAASLEQNRADSRRLADLFVQIYTHPKAVIARINGHAIAGGCGLAAVCDLSIASADARLGFTEVRIGFIPAIVSVFILRKIGEAPARDLFLTGRQINAGEAAGIGLISQAVQPENLDAAVGEIADQIAHEVSPTAIRLTKELLAAVPGMTLHEAVQHAVEINAQARATDDCRAGIASFLSNTAPPWQSRE